MEADPPKEWKWTNNKDPAGDLVVKIKKGLKWEEHFIRENKLWWEGVSRSIKVWKDDLFKYHIQFKYSRESDFDRLIAEAEKDIQIGPVDNNSLHWKIRSHIAKEMRSVGYRLIFYIWKILMGIG